MRDFKNIVKNPKNIVLIIALIIFILMVFSFMKAFIASKGSSTTGERKNYSTIYAIPGVSFEVSQDLSNYATAVTEISKDVDFIKNASYSFKNGTDTYMLFNMAQYVIIAKKGTSFDFNNIDISDSLATNSMDGIWFTNGKIITKTESKSVCSVSAQVVITNTIYNDFYGKLATVTYNGEEWSLFVGSVYAEDSSMSSMIDYTVATFIADESNKGEDAPIYEMEVSEQPILKEVEEIEEVAVAEEVPETSSAIEEVTPEESNEDTVEEEPTVEPETEPEEPAEVPVEEPEEVQVEESVEEAPEETLPAEEETSPAQESEPETETEPEETEAIPTDKVMAASNNQKKTVYSDDKAYTSTIYSMLDIGKIGYMTATNQATGSYDEIFIRVTDVNDKEETQKLIESYIASGQAYYDNMDAPAGCHWESITYNIKHDGEKSYYTNILFVGMDGENLKHRGIGYPMRTYDITNNVAPGDNGWTNGYVAFYAVPNGCTEYAIACGDSVGESGYRAYYKVK